MTIFSSRKIGNQYFLSILILIVLTVPLYYSSLFFDFVGWDDPYYVTNNPLIQSLAWPNIKRIFTSFIMGNYQPLTVFTLALDFKRGGLNPFVFHQTNVLLHTINVILVFILINRLFKNVANGFWVALLFTIHPLRVESVAWVTERKDVLFLLFYLLALICYVGGLESPYKNKKRTLLFFILSLLSKPTAVSFPAVLVLIDYLKGKDLGDSIKRKIPLFILSASFCLLAIRASLQLNDYADDNPTPNIFSTLDSFYLGCQAILLYWQKWLWPSGLSSYYPFPPKINKLLPFYYYVSPVVVSILIWLASRLFENKRLFIFGMSFFGVTIFFNLPFFGVGHAIIADRFSYLPFIGLNILLVEAVQNFFKLMKQNFISSVLSKSFIGFTIVMLMAQTFFYCLTWRNSESLWTNAIHLNPEHSLPYYNRAEYYVSTRQWDKAIKDYDKILNLRPNEFVTYNNRGNMHLLKGEDKEALRDYNTSLSLNPEFLKSHLNRAELYRVNGQYAAALNDIEFVLQKDSHNAFALNAKKLVIEKMTANQ
jgi:tetratricopeptide (TPR) repeat protein